LQKYEDEDDGDDEEIGRMLELRKKAPINSNILALALERTK